MGFSSGFCSPLASAWAAGIQSPPPIAFPDNLKPITSPLGGYQVRIKRLPDNLGAPTYRLSLLDIKRHHRQDIVTFERSVELTWRNGKEGFFLNEYTASNFTDCLIAVPNSTNGTGGLADLQSMIERIKKQPELSIPENVTNSHFYVECRGWNGADQVAVAVFGHKDEDGSGFSYDLKYDLARDTLQR